MNPYNFSVLFFSFCTFFISLLIWLKRQDLIGKAYFVFCLFVTGWGISFSLEISENLNFEEALVITRITNLFAVFVTVTWVHFVLIYVSKVKEFMRLLWILYCLAFTITAFSFSRHFIPTVAPILSYEYYARAGFLFYVFTGMFFIAVPLTFYLLIRFCQKSNSREDRTQRIGFTIATAVGFQGGAFSFFPAYGLSIPQYSLFLMPLYPFLMAYFMIRKNLFSEQDLAQAAHQNKLAAIGTLAASINHEIKNPLYIIQGLADSYLVNRQQSMSEAPERMMEKTDEILKKTSEQAQRAIEIMKKFLLFSKPVTLSASSRTDLYQALQTVLQLIRHDFEINKINVEIYQAPGLPLLKCDSRQLEEILFNLFLNASQAMKASGGLIKVDLTHNERSIIIGISDNGPGIPPDRLKRIFEPFYTTKAEGTGLGLYITKQLVEKNDGKITIESEPQKGTRGILEFKKA